jgi:multiple antibiotic resistance protein
MADDVRRIVQGILIAVAALMPIVNPLGTAPLFLALTHQLTDAERAVLARKVAINGFVLLSAAVLVGGYVLDFFGVSVPVLQMAGGLVVASLGFRLLHDSDSNVDSSPMEGTAALSAKAFYPLTLPLTVGPGAISVAVTLGANLPSTPKTFTIDALAVLTGALIVCITTYFCLAFAKRLTREKQILLRVPRG